MKKISLIPYACGEGAKIKNCASGPSYLLQFGLAEKLTEKGYTVSWADNISIANPTNDSTQIIAEHCLYLTEQILTALENNLFPITIGGDHSMAIGTWTGVHKYSGENSTLGLVWVDAHMDAHNFNTSQTGNLHGMPVSYILGHQEGPPSGLLGEKNHNIIAPQNLCLVGVRSFEDEEVAFLAKMGVRTFFMDDIKERGIEKIMQEAIAIATKNTDKFGISIDIDAFDPEIAPGTGTKEKNGIMAEEFIDAISKVDKHTMSKLIALEIAEYNPHLDKDQITANLVLETILAVLGRV